MRPMTGTKTRRGKRILENREAKVHENDKKAILVKGGKTSETVSSAIRDLYLLKKPLALQLKRRNPFHPFEDETPIEKFSAKFDSSLFLFGSNSKKHPNSLIFGRMFDGHLLDMAELRVLKYKPAAEFDTPRPVLGSKPCLVLEGPAFESDEAMKRVGNLMVDWFRGPKLETVRLQGLEFVIVLTAHENDIAFRVYRTVLLKSTTTTPRVELRELGPAIDFRLERKKLASDSLFKEALKQPKELTRKKLRKNVTQDVMGNTLARIHIGKQGVDNLQTRKMKALKKGKKKGTEEEGEDTAEMETEE